MSIDEFIPDIQSVRRLMAMLYEYNGAPLQQQRITLTAILRDLHTTLDQLKSAREEAHQQHAEILSLRKALEVERQRSQELAREQAARSRAEKQLQRQTLLAEVSKTLAFPITYADTLARVVRQIIPYLADWCVIDLVEPDGHIRRVAAAHKHVEGEHMLQDLQSRYPPDLRLPDLVLPVLQTRESELILDISDTVLEACTRDAEHADVLRQLGTRSAMIVPLTARERVVGAIACVSATADRYTPDDLALAEDLAYRIAAAVDQAYLYREAREAICTRDHFLTIAAHELKSPLTALLGLTSLLQRRATRADVPAEQNQHVLQMIGTQASRFNDLVNTLLDVSHIQTERFNIQCAPVDLCALVQQVVEAVQPALKKHTLSFTSPGQPLVIAGDALRLRQVVHNLIENAITYSPAGGTVQVGVEQCDGMACMHISDQGIGIPAAALPRLFGRFYRAPNAESQQIKGMGVGLYIVKEIVALHNGTVEVASREGAGSTFTVALPLMQRQPHPQNLSETW